ncbi:MAG: FAD binding domain-containing protein [Nitrososphaerales archaeon]
MPLFNPEQLLRPTSVKEAIEILERESGSARLVAGDTTLYDLAQHNGLDDVKTLVDTSNLGLSYIRDNGNDLEVGATTTFSELEHHKRSCVARGLDALFETAAKITPPQVRNMATIGGALCSGIPFLDMPTTVLALGAEIHTSSPRGERRIKADEFFIDYFQTAVEFDEIVTSIHFHYTERGASSFLKLGRVTVDFAVVNVTTWISLDKEGRCAQDKIALGAIASTPIRWKSLEEKMVGKLLTQESIAKIISESKEIGFEPQPSLGAPSNYKKLVIPILVKNSLLESLKRSMAADQ